MQASSESFVIRTFTSGQWDGRGNPKPVNVFARFRGIPLGVGIIALFILANLGGFWTVLVVLAIIGLVVVITRSKGKLSPQQQFVNDLMAEVNDTVIELTGNMDARLSVKDLVSLRESSEDVPLPVNGVSGLGLRIVSDGPRQERVAAIARVADRVWTTRVIVSASPPDYATASFDRLLEATLDGD